MNIYPDGHPWRPVNGTEAENFTKQWCDNCLKDEGCIIPYSVLSGQNDQPNAWVFNKGRAICTEFEFNNALLDQIPY